MTTAEAVAARARPALTAKPALMPAVNPAGSMSASARACRFGTAAVAAVVIGVEASPIPTPASSSPGSTCRGV
jgi:hypothetical protein